VINAKLGAVGAELDPLVYLLESGSDRVPSTSKRTSPTTSPTHAQLDQIMTRPTPPARASLIGTGIVYAPGHGMIASTVPGMADYVRGRDAEDNT
jgi:hypothetical protein